MIHSAILAHEKVAEAAAFIRSRTTHQPRVAVILGSGLGDFANRLSPAHSIATPEIPHYPLLSVEGHKGEIVVGTLEKTPLLVFQGRVHYYEAGTTDATLFPISVARELGIDTLLITNAAGGIHPSFRAGDLMLITDQINLTFAGSAGNMPSPAAPRPLYDERLMARIGGSARRLNIRLRRGVYCGVAGPSYETAAEIRMIRKIGGDAVGMSTVNEVSHAAHLGIAVAGISCITNLSTGITGEKLSHAEVTVVADRVKHTFSRLIGEFIASLSTPARSGRRQP